MASTDAILGQWLQDLLQSMPAAPGSESGHEDTSGFYMEPPFLSRDVPRDYSREGTTGITRSFLHSYNQLIQLYHTNIMEYQRTISYIMDYLNREHRSHRTQAIFLDNLVYPYSRTMHEYNEIMRDCLDTLHDIQRSDPRPPAPAMAGSGANPAPIWGPVRMGMAAPSAAVRPRVGRTVTLFQDLPAGYRTAAPLRPPVRVPAPGSALGQPMLTQEQIRRTTVNRIYNADLTQVSEAEPSVCPISLENFHEGDLVTHIRHCNHVFHAAPLYRWFLRDSRCPVCRYNLWDASFSDVGSGTDGAAAVAAAETPPRNRSRSATEPTLTLPPTFSIHDTAAASANTNANASAADNLLRQWLSTIAMSSSPPPGFTNMDLDITYSIEYDVSGALL